RDVRRSTRLIAQPYHTDAHGEPLVTSDTDRSRPVRVELQDESGSDRTREPTSARKDHGPDTTRTGGDLHQSAWKRKSIGHAAQTRVVAVDDVPLVVAHPHGARVELD